MRYGYSRRLKGMVKATVSFDGGAVISDVPFWMSDANIVSQAMLTLGPLARFVKTPVVRRGEPY
jgi:hypothetical protein